MKRMSLALVLAAAVGSFGTQGLAQAAGTKQATASHVSKAHAPRTHAVMARQKSAKTVRAHKAVLPVKSRAPKGTADGIYSFTG